MTFVADPNHAMRVFDREGGWEVATMRGQVQASEGAIAAVPMKVGRIGAKSYRFFRHAHAESGGAAAEKEPAPRF